MKYMVLMTVDESYWQNLTPEEMRPMIETMDAYNDELRAAGVWVQGEGLDFSSNARSVRVDQDGARTVENGPFDSQVEQVGGFWIIETESIDDAVEWAKKVPLSGGGIEVRGILPADYAG